MSNMCDNIDCEGETTALKQSKVVYTTFRFHPHTTHKLTHTWECTAEMQIKFHTDIIRIFSTNTNEYLLKYP